MKVHTAANLVDVPAEWNERLSQEIDFPRSRSSRKNRKRRDEAENVDHHHEEDSENGLTSLTQVSGITFCSRSEAICAELLRRYVPHFEIQEGLTFQVPIGIDRKGNTLSVDFLVDGVLFEYHPARFFRNRGRWGDFRGKQEHRDYRSVYHSLRGEQREFFQDAMRAQLTRNYYAKRRAILDQHPTYRRMELVVANSPEEFYFLILKRFGKNVPRTVERFLAIFAELRETLPS